MKVQHIVGYQLKKQPFTGFKILKVYYNGKEKDKLRSRTIFKNLSYSDAEEKMYELDNKIHN